MKGRKEGDDRINARVRVRDEGCVYQKKKKNS